MLLLRTNNGRRIRESIYCTRTGKTKNRISRYQILGDGLLSEHYSGLVKAFRKVLHNDDADDSSCPPKHNKQRIFWNTTTEECCQIQNCTTFETIRANPEIMLRIYSYLPVVDRIHRLAMVDREFARDTIRGGIVGATYGPGFNLKQALLELEYWATNHTCWPQPILSRIERMTEAANLTDVELLLFTGSNLVNTIVTPAQRRRWMTIYINDFFRREEKERRQQQQERRQQQCRGYYTWLEEAVLVQKFLTRYFFDGKINRLRQLMTEEGFLEYAEKYRCSRASSSKNEIDENGNLVWCLPDLLSPGCNLLLLDPDTEGGWKEHRFVGCSSAHCSKIIHDSNNRHTNRDGYFCCRFCDDCATRIENEVIDDEAE